MLVSDKQVQYRGIPLEQALKVFLHNYSRIISSLRNKPISLFLYCIQRLLAVCKRIIIGSLANSKRLSSGLSKLQDGKYFLIVSEYAGHVEKMAVALLEQFPKDKIIFLTGNPIIYKDLKKKFPNCLNIYKKIYCYRLNRLFHYYRYYKKLILNLKYKNPLFRLCLFSAMCSALEAIDFYNCFFENVKISAVMTMCDTHFNEHVATMCAKRYGIMTYTNQHGEICDAVGYTPVVSDKIFVWGEKSREILIKNGVPEKKIVISGNPKFDLVYSWYLPQREKIYTRITSQHGLKKDLPVVTYLSSGLYSTENFTPREASALLRCFCNISNLPVNMIIKLHPNDDDKRLFQKWLNELGLSRRVLIFQKEDLFDILNITNITVTFRSTTGVESIGFGIPTVVLNIIKDINPREYITYIEDSIVCKTSEEFKQVMKKMIMEPEYYQWKVRRTLGIREKYIKNSENFNTSKFVRDYIINELS